MFAHLHCHSNFSFGSGTISPEELPQLASKFGMKAVAMTDTNNMSGAVQFYIACKKANIKPILGIELKTKSERVVLIAKNTEGYREICNVTTRVLDAIPQIKPKITFEMLMGSVEVEERVMPSSRSLLEFIEHLSENVFILTSDESLLERFGQRKKQNLYLELILAEQQKWKLLRGIHARHKIPIIVTNNVHFAEKEEHSLHRVMRAIGLNTNLGMLPSNETAKESQFFCSEESLRRSFSNFLGEIFDNVESIIEQCKVEFDLHNLKFARFPSDNPEALLRSLAERGFKNRYETPSDIHRERFEFEFELITRMKATSYYLATHDMIEFAKGKGFPYLGRGSGANSLIAYCLEISNVDPIENNLRFERFLNPERTMPPDFDIDFSWKDRYEVINYMLDKHGRDRSAMLCTIQTYKDRAPIREVGKALGYGDEEINTVMSRLGELYHTSQQKSSRIGNAGKLSALPDLEEWLLYAGRIAGFPHHLSVHAGGVIIADKTIDHYSPVQQAPIGVPIMQQDMFTADEWKLVKLDVLATRGLGTYWDTVNLVKRRTGELPPVTDVRVALSDEKTKEMVRTAQTKGCFYIESPAMISLLKKLSVDTFSMLTAASSVIRPGVASSGMMNEFIQRHHDPSRRSHIHPKMGELLSETYGIMIYQEDVLTVVHELAGLSYGEADLFRRAMSGKLRSKDFMVNQREKFVSGCMKNGLSFGIADELWRQVSSFSGYAFCKAHSASYSVLSFQEAWLKVYYPAEFLCSVLNNYGGFYSHQEYVNEAKRLGITVKLPDVNLSEWKHDVPEENVIRIGFESIREVSNESIANLLNNRTLPYRDIEDFALRSGVTPEDGRKLIALGVCDSFGMERPEIQILFGTIVRGRTSVKPKRKKSMFTDQLSLEIASNSVKYELNHLTSPSKYNQFLTERKYLGYSVTAHPFEFLKQYTPGTTPSFLISDHVNKTVKVLGHVAARKGVRTKKGEPMEMLNLSDQFGTMDIVVFPDVYRQYYSVLSSSQALKVTGVVKESFGVESLIASSLEQLSFIES